MSIITVKDLSYTLGRWPLLAQVNLTIAANERIALVGRNGAGKSTLLQLLAGQLRADAGDIQIATGVRVAYLPQDVPTHVSGRVRDIVASGLADVQEKVQLFDQLIAQNQADSHTIAQLQATIDHANGWTIDQQVSETLTRFALDPQAEFEQLSGGMRRRVLLAQAVIAKPHLLLLDEPTNHLDIAAIDWLETFLQQWPGSVLVITHDRHFLQRVAQSIFEIDRGQLTCWPGDWDNYQRRLQERGHARQQHFAQADRFLAQEEQWIRQGVKARRTRDAGRVKRLEQLRAERASRREAVGTVQMQAATGQASGQKVIQVDNLSYGIDGRNIVNDWSITIRRGERVGLIGPNGSGKTTVLKLLLGQLAPTQGQVQLGSQIQWAVFDQYRSTLRSDWTILENVSQGRDWVEVNHKPQHILSYLQRFLFSPEQARSPIHRLSGGEKNRVVLARLFAQPSNVLVLDEPTNDLDIQTLEQLEILLKHYPGTVLVVSHDRAFLDHVATVIVAIESDGRIGRYLGNYHDWQRQHASAHRGAPPEASQAATPKRPKALATQTQSRPKRRYQDTRELAELPQQIADWEARLHALTQVMREPQFYQRDHAKVAQDLQEVTRLQTAINTAYARWEQLDSS